MANLVERWVRTCLALGAILPGILIGLIELVRGRDRRHALNRTIATWGRLGTKAAGIELDIDGGEHLERSRPCVFLINHQSGVDPIILCAVLQRDFVGVAKKEIRRNPFLGPAFAFVGTAFVDRSDRVQAIEALKPAVDILRSGLSIAIAPEGTRVGGPEIGPFKKGAFRLAMAAGVPVVPIVICNSRDVLPRGSYLMRPATVRVVVHPPVCTQSWTLDALDEEIERVRGIYRRTLDSYADRDGMRR